jgi:hypothetical protein
MLGKHALDGVSRKLIASVFETRADNKELVQKKLRFYRKLLLAPNQQNLEETLNIISAQNKVFRELRELLNDAYRTKVKPTPHTEMAFNLIREGENLLNTLTHELVWQDAFLKHKNEDIASRIGNYREHFKKELAVYREFEELSKKASPSILEDALNEISRRQKFKVDLKYSLTGIGVFIVALVAMGVMSDPNNDLKNALELVFYKKLATTIVATAGSEVIFLLISRATQRLARIQKVIKKEK